MADKLPFFPFYARGFSSDAKVEAMTTREVGAYMLLLCKAWHEDPVGSVPDDDVILARWSRLGPEGWATSRGRILSAFALGEDGRYHQKRMGAEYAKLAGRYGGRRKPRRQADNPASLQEMPYKDYLLTEWWRSVREGALDRAGRRCQLCNSAGPLNVHHRTYERRGHELPGDVIALCRPCHAKFHNKLP